MTRVIIKGIYLKTLLINFKTLKRFHKIDEVLTYKERISLENLIEDLEKVEYQLDILESVLTTFDNVSAAYKIINADPSFFFD